MKEQKNDFLAVKAKLGDADNEDLIRNGINASNSELKDKSFYESKDAIKERFKNEDGDFDSEEFDSFYNNAKESYIGLDREETTSRVEDSFKVLDSSAAIIAGYDTIKPSERISVSEVTNRMGATLGLTDFGISDESKYTVSEVAQQQLVYDKNGKELNITAEDYNRKFSNLDSTLVLAQYDEDGQHLNHNGEMEKHVKGDYKKNDQGSFFYEELGDKDSFGRQSLSYFDTITDEGSFANKWDFMDSDGKDKHAAGIIAKSAIKTIPLFIPYVNVAYGTALVGSTLADALPKLAKTFMGMTDENAENSAFYKKMNKLESISKKYSSSGMSEYGRTSMFTLESMSNLVYDSFAQLRGQQLVAKGAHGLVGLAQVAKGLKVGTPAFAKAMEKSSWIAKNLSTLYLASTASSQMYDATKKAGLDENASGALYLGYTAALFGLFSAGEYAQLALKGVGLDEYSMQMNRAVLSKSDDMAKELISLHAKNSATAGGAVSNANIFKAGYNQAKRLVNSVNKGTFLKDGYKGTATRDGSVGELVGAMSAEAIEEMTEQTLHYSMLGLHNMAASNGIHFDERTSKVHFTMAEAAQDILASGVGGGLGGALFHKAPKIERLFGMESQDPKNYDLHDLIIQGESDRAISHIDKMMKNGELGSKILDIGDVQKNDTDTKIISRADQISENEFVGNLMKNYVKTLDSWIKTEGVPDLESIAGNYNAMMGHVVDTKTNTTLIEDVKDVAHRIIKKRGELETERKNLNSLDPDLAKDEYGVIQKRIKEAEDDLGVLRDRMQSINDGEKADHYFRQGLFNMSQNVNKNFGVKDFAEFAIEDMGYSYEDLSKPGKMEEATIAYQKHKDENRYGELVNGFSEYNRILAEKFDMKKDGTIPSLSKFKKEMKDLKDLHNNLKSKNLKVGVTASEKVRMDEAAKMFNLENEEGDLEYDYEEPVSLKEFVGSIKAIDQDMFNQIQSKIQENNTILNEKMNYTKSLALKDEIKEEMLSSIDGSVNKSPEDALKAFYILMNADISDDQVSDSHIDMYIDRIIDETFDDDVQPNSMRDELIDASKESFDDFVGLMDDIGVSEFDEFSGMSNQEIYEFAKKASSIHDNFKEALKARFPDLDARAADIREGLISESDFKAKIMKNTPLRKMNSKLINFLDDAMESYERDGLKNFTLDSTQKKAYDEATKESKAIIGALNGIESFNIPINAFRYKNEGKPNDILSPGDYSAASLTIESWLFKSKALYELSRDNELQQRQRLRNSKHRINMMSFSALSDLSSEMNLSSLSGDKHVSGHSGSVVNVEKIREKMAMTFIMIHDASSNRTIIDSVNNKEQIEDNVNDVENSIFTSAEKELVEIEDKFYDEFNTLDEAEKDFVYQRLFEGNGEDDTIDNLALSLERSAYDIDIKDTFFSENNKLNYIMTLDASRTSDFLKEYRGYKLEDGTWSNLGTKDKVPFGDQERVLRMDHAFRTGKVRFPKLKVFEKYPILRPLNVSMAVNGKGGTGKAQPLTSLIYTPDGYKYMGDIAVGDNVLSKGSIGSVTDVFPKGLLDIYRVSFNDGSYTHACADHLWSVSCNNERALTYPSFNKTQFSKISNDDEVVMKTIDIVDNGFKYSRGGYKFAVPTFNAEFDEREITVDPFLLGTLLASGKVQEKLTVGNIPNELMNELEFRDDDLEFVKINNGYSVLDHSGTLMEALNEYNLFVKGIKGRFIPDEYKYNSTETRMDVLNGFISASEFIPKRSSVVITSANKRLLEDMVELARSLGYVAKITESQNRYTYNITIYVLNSGINTFEASKSNVKRFISDIEFIGKEEAQCIMIDHESHLYLTDNFIATHNTSIAINNAAQAVDKKDGSKNVALFVPSESQIDGLYSSATEGKEGSNIDRSLSSDFVGLFKMLFGDANVDSDLNIKGISDEKASLNSTYGNVVIDVMSLPANLEFNKTLDNLDLIVVDEFTNIDSKHIVLINSMINKYNESRKDAGIKIKYTGDHTQLSHENTVIGSGVLMYTAPELGVAVRSSINHINAAQATISSMMSLRDDYMKDPSNNEKTVEEKSDQIINMITSYENELNYSTDEDGDPYGYFLKNNISNSDVVNYIKSIKNKKDSVAYIVRDKEEAKAKVKELSDLIANGSVEVLTYKEVQGREFPHVILDTKVPVDANFEFLRFYITMLSRPKQSMMMLKPDINVTNVERPHTEVGIFSGTDEENANITNELKDIRLKELEVIIGDEEGSSITETPGTSSENSSLAKSTPVETPVTPSFDEKFINYEPDKNSIIYGFSYYTPLGNSKNEVMGINELLKGTGASQYRGEDLTDQQMKSKSINIHERLTIAFLDQKHDPNDVDSRIVDVGFDSKTLSALNSKLNFNKTKFTLDHTSINAISGQDGEHVGSGSFEADPSLDRITKVVAKIPHKNNPKEFLDVTIGFMNHSSQLRSKSNNPGNSDTMRTKYSTLSEAMKRIEAKGINSYEIDPSILRKFVSPPRREVIEDNKNILYSSLLKKIEGINVVSEPRILAGSQGLNIITSIVANIKAKGLNPMEEEKAVKNAQEKHSKLKGKVAIFVSNKKGRYKTDSDLVKQYARQVTEKLTDGTAGDVHMVLLDERTRDYAETFKDYEKISHAIDKKIEQGNLSPEEKKKIYKNLNLVMQPGKNFNYELFNDIKSIAISENTNIPDSVKNMASFITNATESYTKRNMRGKDESKWQLNIFPASLFKFASRYRNYHINGKIPYDRNAPFDPAILDKSLNMGFQEIIDDVNDSNNSMAKQAFSGVNTEFDNILNAFSSELRMARSVRLKNEGKSEIQTPDLPITIMFAPLGKGKSRSNDDWSGLATRVSLNSDAGYGNILANISNLGLPHFNINLDDIDGILDGKYTDIQKRDPAVDTSDLKEKSMISNKNSKWIISNDKFIAKTSSVIDNKLVLNTLDSDELFTSEFKNAEIMNRELKSPRSIQYIYTDLDGSTMSTTLHLLDINDNLSVSFSPPTVIETDPRSELLSRFKAIGIDKNLVDSLSDKSEMEIKAAIRSDLDNKNSINSNKFANGEVERFLKADIVYTDGIPMSIKQTEIDPGSHLQSILNDGDEFTIKRIAPGLFQFNVRKSNGSFFDGEIEYNKELYSMRIIRTSSDDETGDFEFNIEETLGNLESILEVILPDSKMSEHKDTLLRRLNESKGEGEVELAILEFADEWNNQPLFNNSGMRAVIEGSVTFVNGSAYINIDPSVDYGDIVEGLTQAVPSADGSYAKIRYNKDGVSTSGTIDENGLSSDSLMYEKELGDIAEDFNNLLKKLESEGNAKQSLTVALGPNGIDLFRKGMIALYSAGADTTYILNKISELTDC